MTTSAFQDNHTLFERWYDRKPDVSHLRVFGCTAYAHVPNSERRKLDKKAKKLRFVGYSKNPKGYRLIDDKTMKVKVKRDVVFNDLTTDSVETDYENKYSDQINLDSKDVSPVVPESSEMEEEASVNQRQEEPRHSQRLRRQPDRYGCTTEYADMTTVDHLAFCVRNS